MSLTHASPTSAAPARKTAGVPAWVWVLLVLFVIGPIVLATLAIVAAVAIPSLLIARVEADQAKVQADLRQITSALQIYVEINGEVPATLHVLVSPASDGSVYLNMNEVPTDPWGRPYRYEVDPAKSMPVVYTLGQDGRPGGELMDADIDNLAMY